MVTPLEELRSKLLKYQSAVNERKANPNGESEESLRIWFDRMRNKVDALNPEIQVLAPPMSPTKLVHTLKIWAGLMNITMVANYPYQLKSEWMPYLTGIGINHYTHLDEFKNNPRVSGIAISLCQKKFMEEGAKIAKDKGLYIIWSNEMMWHFGGELDLIRDGIIDVVLYTSQFNKDTLSVEYNRIRPSIRSHIVSNYIDPSQFPFKQRPKSDVFTIGRLSREDPDKYPVDFPLSYEFLGLKNPRYKVMAWSEDLSKIYKWCQFGPEWQLLKPNAERSVDFLYSLDLFVYSLGHKFRESWGRAVVEAMLTGCVPIVPTGHNFNEFIMQGETGYMCSTFDEYRARCQDLQYDDELRLQMARNASDHIREHVCDFDKHKKIWAEVFNV
jgi:glycosyltransferase involved in cell wall biosynthesis